MVGQLPGAKQRSSNANSRDHTHKRFLGGMWRALPKGCASHSAHTGGRSSTRHNRHITDGVSNAAQDKSLAAVRGREHLTYRINLPLNDSQLAGATDTVAATEWWMIAVAL